MGSNKFDDFAEISLSTYNLKNLNIDSAKAIAAISKEIETEYAELNSEKVKASRAKHFNIPGAEKEHYAEYLISLSGEKKIICGIRHLGEQKDEAFVSILTNFKTTKDGLLEIYHSSLSKYFKLFEPKKLRYYTSQKVEGNQIRNIYLTQNAHTIKENIQFDLEKDITLINPNNENYYHTYVEEYEKFHQQNPGLKNNVQCNDLQLMESSRKDGLLRQLSFKGQIIGLIAGLKDNFLGQQSIYFIEILVNEGWKRKGFAKAMQRKFVNEICEDNEIIWGTIDIDNKPSIMTAKANLRMEIRYENFLKI